MKNLQGRNVALSVPIKPLCGGKEVPVGVGGFVRWDEGGEEVLVEFEVPVPNGGIQMDNERQTWVPRSSLKITK